MTTTRREQIASHEEEIHLLLRRKRILERYVAQFGSAAEPGRVLELEDVDAQLMQLQQTLTQLRTVTPDAQAPYMGLKTFDEAHARFFYGREALIDTLVARVEHSTFLTVIGPSGSGKSSVVRAGLIPALKQGLDLAGSDQWMYVAPFPPGPRPMNALAAALAALPERARLGSAFEIDDRLRQRSDALLFCADQLLEGRPNTRLVLVVDQAEELWTLAPSDRAGQEAYRGAQQQPFIAQLLSAAQASDRRVLVILTLRADFMGRVADEPPLAAAVKQQLEIVSPMERPELRRAIELPAEVAGGAFQPGLVDELIDQVAGEPGALPLLEYTLESLWAAKQPDGTMTWETYRAIGGVEGALAKGADRVLDEQYREPAQREAVRELLLRLVQPGDGSSNSRRRVPLGELVPAGSSVEAVQALITPLVNARLLTTGREADTGQETVEVTHEALIRSWPTLRDWIAAAKADLRLQRQLEDAAREWEAEPGGGDLLWQGVRLAHAEAWVAQANPMLLAREQQFLTASRAAETARIDNERRRTRAIIVGLIVALVLITSLAGGTAWFWQAARRNGQVSQARFLVAEGQRRYDEQPLLGLRLMAEGLANVPSDEISLEHDMAAVVMGYIRQGRIGLLANDATKALVGSADAAQQIIIVRRGQPSILAWGAHPQRMLFTSPIATDSSGEPEVVFNPQGELAVLNYAEGKGAALLRADGSVVPLPNRIATNSYSGRLAVTFSPQGELGVLNYAEGKGAALLRADGTIAPIPSPFAIASFGQPAVAFSSHGELVALNYADEKGAALFRADGTAVPLLSPFATDEDGQPAVVFSPQGTLGMLNYTDEKGAALVRADGSVVPLANAIAINSNDARPSVIFGSQGDLAVLNYAEGKGAAIVHADGTVAPLAHSIDTGEGHLAVVFSAHDELIAASYAEGKGATLVRADGTAVPLVSPPAVDDNAQPGVVFSPQGTLGALNYADGNGAALVRVDGTVIALSSPLAIDNGGKPAVEFGPHGDLGVLNYADGKGAALIHAGGKVTPLPRPLATDGGGRVVVVFSPQGKIGVVSYADEMGAALIHVDGRVVPLPNALTTNGNGGLAVAFSPQGELGVMNYAKGKGTVILHADGTLVPLSNQIGADEAGQLAVIFGPQEKIGLINFAEGQGAGLLYAGGKVVPLPSPFGIGSFTQPAVAFSTQGDLAVMNYADRKGAALVRADATIVPLPSLLATDASGKLAIAFSRDNLRFDLEYATGYHELRTLSDLTRPIDLRSNVDSVMFMADGSRVVVSYRDGHVYVIDPDLPPGSSAATTTIAASELIKFICDGPLQSGFWTSQDDTNLTSILQGNPPQACGAIRP